MISFPTIRLPVNGGTLGRTVAAFGLVLVAMTQHAASQRPLRIQTHHYAFFGRDRELLPGHAFLANRQFEGAQITYAWKQLERGEDSYEFGDIDADLQILKASKKRLWIQLQDTTFMPNNQAVPAYIMKRKEYNGGANPEYDDAGKVEGW